MIASIYPSSLSEWTAVITALVPIFALAGSALWRGWTYSGERHEKEWARLYRIADILTNLDPEKGYGVWEQMVAVRELETLRINRNTAILIAKDALRLWDEKSADKNEKVYPVLDELRRLIKRNSGCWIKRAYWRIRSR